jgi:hypothetical protein
VADSAEPPLALGTRVRVHRDALYGPGPWPAEPTGRVESLGGHSYEEIETRQGPDRMYFVQFDEPQYDADGDGPYKSSQVLGRYLERLAEDRG